MRLWAPAAHRLKAAPRTRGIGRLRRIRRGAYVCYWLIAIRLL